MKKIFTFIAVAIMAISTASAQHEIGGIVGGLNGLSYKYWFTDHVALQADLAVGLTQGATSMNGFSMNMGLWDFTANPNVAYHWDLPVDGLKIYAGGGFNIGMVGVVAMGGYGGYASYGYYAPRRAKGYSYGGGGADVAGKFGANAIGGVCYNFSNIPLALAADFRPGYGLMFTEGASISYFDWKISASVRYCF